MKEHILTKFPNLRGEVEQKTVFADACDDLSAPVHMLGHRAYRNVY